MPNSVFNSRVADCPAIVLDHAKKIGFKLSGSVIHNLFRLNGVIEVSDGKCQISSEDDDVAINPLIANSAIKPLFEECPPSVSLKIIEAFGLDRIFELKSLMNNVFALESADLKLQLT